MKIVATLGPASSEPEMLERLFEAGVDVFRINMSHASHDVARKLHATVRNAEVKLSGRSASCATCRDRSSGSARWRRDARWSPRGRSSISIATRRPAERSAFSCRTREIFQAIEPGHTLLLDDGKLRMRVVEKSASRITAEVIVGGALASRKGIAMPDTLLPISPITEKDRADLDYALRLGVDWIALSFVQRGEDIHLARQLIGQGAAIMAKIEKPAAIHDLDNIVAAVDGLMVARGDLGVELPVERVPGLQKQITRKARAAGKPVVVATQMLESMISSPVPTRAEVSDVATAVFDGADAIMLSAESSVGQFPVEAIEMMNCIAIEVEKDPSYDALVHATQTQPQPTPADAIATAAHAIADTVKLSAIICYTATGSTALRVARERPNLPVIGLTPVLSTGRRLSLVWGTHSVLTGDPENLADMVRKACRIAMEEEFAKPRDGILITAGVPLGSPGATNMLRVAFLDEKGAPAAEGT